MLIDEVEDELDELVVLTVVVVLVVPEIGLRVQMMLDAWVVSYNAWNGILIMIFPGPLFGLSPPVYLILGSSIV